MFISLLKLMGFLLAGEVLVAVTGINFPGALAGMLLLLVWLQFSGGPDADLEQSVSGLSDHLGLLFVPAGTAILVHGPRLLGEGLAIGLSLVISTLIAIAVTGIIAGIEIRHSAPDGHPENA